MHHGHDASGGCKSRAADGGRRIRPAGPAPGRAAPLPSKETLPSRRSSDRVTRATSWSFPAEGGGVVPLDDPPDLSLSPRPNRMPGNSKSAHGRARAVYDSGWEGRRQLALPRFDGVFFPLRRLMEVPTGGVFLHLSTHNTKASHRPPPPRVLRALECSLPHVRPRRHSRLRRHPPGNVLERSRRRSRRRLLA